LDITDYLRIFRRYWWLVVLLTIIGAGIGYGTTRVVTPEYKSTATLFVAAQNGTTVAEAYQNNLFAEERVISYAGLATSQQVAARAVDQLKAPITADQLRSKISAVPLGKTVLLEIGVTDPDPAQAQAYAGAVADQLIGLTAELETSRRGGTPAAGAVLVDDANYPTEPLGMTPITRTILGVAGGLALGLVVAVLVGVFDRRLRAREPVESVTGALVMGALPADPVRRKSGVVDLASDSLYVERLRELRTNLRFTATPNGRPPRMIAVTSPSPGEGRTTTATDLAAALAESGRSVVVVDGDLRHPALGDRLPLNDAMRSAAASRGLSTLLVGEHDLAEALIADIAVNGHSISLLPAGPTAPRPGEVWANDRALTLFEDLARDFDYVVVDTPPSGVFTDAAIAGALCDGAIALARIKRTKSSALRRALQTLRAANITVLGTVVTFEPVGRRALRRHRKECGHAAERVNHHPADSAMASGNRHEERENAFTAPTSDGGLVGSNRGQNEGR
jgi:capsular exopolysaccharide synthesis family protein